MNRRIITSVIIIMASINSVAQWDTISNNNEVSTTDEIVGPVLRISNEIRIPNTFAANDPTIGTLDNTGFGVNIHKTEGIGFAFNDAHQMVFKPNGNMGVGTTTPDGKLDIYGANFNTTNLVLSANYENKLRWRFNTIDRGNAIDLDITSSDSGDNQEAVLKLSRSNSTRPEFQLHNNTLVANNGNVGIGTASPSEKLHVVGDILSNKILLNDPITVNDWNTIWQSGFYQSYDGANAPESGQWFWGVNLNHSSNHSSYRYNGQIAIRNSSTNPIMYFRSTNQDGIGTWARIVHSQGNQFINGNLGIGTTTPDAKLTVNGDIHTREVRVDLDGAVAPDYVFHENYDLRSLEEVQDYIKQQGHLPNIPSAKEMEKNGLLLKEMNLKLLEKIEELTLYILQQEQRNKNQEKRIHNQEKRIGNQEKRMRKLEQQVEDNGKN